MGTPVFEATKGDNNTIAETRDGDDPVCLTENTSEDAAAYIEEDGYPAPYRNILKKN